MAVFFTDTEMERFTRDQKNGPDGKPDWQPPWMRGSMPLYIFGTGEAGRVCLEKMPRLLADTGRLAGFLDNNPALTGSVIRGLPVFRPDHPRNAGEDPCVLVASWSAKHRYQMLRDCARLGYPAYTTLWLDMLMFKNSRPPRYFEEHPGALAGLDIWADAASRRTYWSLIRARSSRDIGDIPRAADCPIYFDTRVPAKYYRCFVDGGAFDGDTLPFFLDHTGNDFDRYFAFEPGAEAFSRLSTRLAHDDRATAFNAALLDRPGEATFHDDPYYAPGSYVDSAREGIKVPATSIDAALAGECVTLIKLDIEGAEPLALKGARETIIRQRPALAVCVYHEPEHLWEIPLWIRDLDLGYRFYCVHHSDVISETVCYAVPSRTSPRPV